MVPFMRKKDLEGVSHTLTMVEYNKLQIEHILKHKWYLSEKVGHEVSIDDAVYDWNHNGWAEMFRRTFNVVDANGNKISNRCQSTI